LEKKEKIMGRILAIDYGEKRCGIAVTDSFKMIANALQTVETKELMTFLKNYFQKENVEILVVGEPKRMSNEPSSIAPKIEKFIQDFKNQFPDIKVERVDERFTSKMAFQTMIDAGLKKKDRQNKALVDSISATIILQSYLESKSF
jgi:putative Holliday junction resolvase